MQSPYFFYLNVFYQVVLVQPLEIFIKVFIACFSIQLVEVVYI